MPAGKMVVFSGTKSKRITVATIWFPNGETMDFNVVHFETENAILSFESDDGVKYAFSLPFRIVEKDS